MNKRELDKILKLHEKWLRRESGGVRANLRSANLIGANLEDANLRSANLIGANLEDAELRRANLIGADLSDANLSDTNLKYTNLSDANLKGADLSDANLKYANLEEANLRGAKLRGANLSDTNLRLANMRGANLSGTNLKGANLDFSCLPLWCGSLQAHMDDRQVTQLLYHVLSIVKYSDNVSDDLKSKLLTDQNLDIANEFHRVGECGEL